MAEREYFEVKITGCPCSDYWYSDIIGEILEVKKTRWDGSFYETRQGESISRYDVMELPKNK